MKLYPPLLSALIALACSAGCAGPQRINPSFELTAQQARVAIREMERRPKALERPLVILGGFSDPIGASLLRQTCSDLFEDDAPIITVSFFGCSSFEQCRQRVLDAVDRAFPSEDPDQTIEVDVIGISMGGLVARVAAEPEETDEPVRRLRIARLFTISSPLRGARLAQFPIALTTMHRDMRAGSPLLERLNATDPPYPIYSYTRLRDQTVGERLASPAGQDPWWVDITPLESAHMGAMWDKRILADIARRLRGEQPYTTEPPAPLPTVADGSP